MPAPLRRDSSEWSAAIPAKPGTKGPPASTLAAHVFKLKRSTLASGGKLFVRLKVKVAGS